jgi:hypothetical protein
LLKAGWALIPSARANEFSPSATSVQS